MLKGLAKLVSSVFKVSVVLRNPVIRQGNANPLPWIFCRPFSRQTDPGGEFWTITLFSFHDLAKDNQIDINHQFI